MEDNTNAVSSGQEEKEEEKAQEKEGEIAPGSTRVTIELCTREGEILKREVSCGAFILSYLAPATGEEVNPNNPQEGILPAFFNNADPITSAYFAQMIQMYLVDAPVAMARQLRQQEDQERQKQSVIIAGPGFNGS